ncbi:ANTAR domain-containing protein [Motilibacter peucedani]|uniref:ANTAR domain-containing protein n=1 Tax=Motilibacter peucedani TaxID=598650 RepID=A0A420XQI4_9ACTN|nr:ANTAR domain-containing protein [Motilibacter peucedani]
MTAWGEHLAALDDELARREAEALTSGTWTPRELAALASERDALAEQWDELAAVHDARATRRDEAALARDVEATRRGRRRDSGAGAHDPAGERFLAARERDAALVEREGSRAERQHASDDRGRGARARERAAADRDQAVQRAEAGDAEVSALHQALETSRQVGMARGMLMERHGVDGDGAFRLLAALARQAASTVPEAAAVLVAAAGARGAGAGQPADAPGG